MLDRLVPRASGPHARRAHPAALLEVPRIEDIEVTLIGAGRAGANVAIVLAMLGARLRIYDADRLGPENQGLQLYAKPDVDAGRLKVDALCSWVTSVVPGARIVTHAEVFVAHRRQPVSPVIVIAVDRMETRRRLWERLHDRADVVLWIDVRLGRGLLRVLNARLRHAADCGADREADVHEYEASLYDDAIAETTDCSDEGTSHAASAAAGLVGGAVRAFVASAPYPRWIAMDLDRGQWSAGPARR